MRAYLPKEEKVLFWERLGGAYSGRLNNEQRKRVIPQALKKLTSFFVRQEKILRKKGKGFAREFPFVSSEKNKAVLPCGENPFIAWGPF
jgi:hypothetical protein